jgi:hypothetical protein
VTSRSRREGRPSGCRARHCAPQPPQQRGTLRTMALPGSPGRIVRERLSRQRSRPPAHHRRGRSRRIYHLSDHADGTTLGRRRRPRRPGMRRTASGTASATGAMTVAAAATATASGTEAEAAAGTATGAAPGRPRCSGDAGSPPAPQKAGAVGRVTKIPLTRPAFRRPIR